MIIAGLLGVLGAFVAVLVGMLVLTKLQYGTWLP
jgi:hypothetical protein